MKKIILIPLVFLSVISCKQEREVGGGAIEVSEPDPLVVDLKNQLGQLQQQLLEEQNLRVSQQREQAMLLGEMKGLLKEEAVVVVAERVLPLTGPSDLEEMGVKNLEAGRVARLKAQGEEYVSLTTLSGEEYHDLVIHRITDIGVVFRHRGGVARVAFTDLKAAWRERFYYDEGRALLAQKSEKLAQLRYERVAGARVAALEQQEKEEADALSLGRLAEAVEGLSRRGLASAPAAVVRQRFSVDPPIIRRHQRSRSNRIYCPPVIRSRVICPPLVRPLATYTGFSPTTICPTPVRPTVQRTRLRPGATTPIRRVATSRQMTLRGR